MILKFIVLTAAILVCEGTIQDRLYARTSPRFWLNNPEMRRPGPNWVYQIINGRPVISGYPNGHSYVAFGLNPQTGQIEQTQVITQTRPGGPIINMIQNMLHVAGQFFGQLTGAVSNVVGGALHTAGQFGQDIQDITNPVASITGISQPVAGSQPIQQPSRPTEEASRPTAAPTAAPALSASTPDIESIPAEAKSEIQSAPRTIDQVIITFQTFRTNIQTNFQSSFESEDGIQALAKVNENIDWVVSKLQKLRETALVDPTSALKSGQTIVNAGLDNVEAALGEVTGTQGREFIEPTRNELNKTFDGVLQVFEQSPATEIYPLNS